ncbi:MAG: anti-anti-sigma factor [Acidobacteria bacterium]|nr:MAG: anti-anti-sigma factor [Acidobacteriota bacterium]
MQVVVRQINGVSIVDMEGKITIGDGDVQLRETIDSLLELKHKKILLNMERIGYMDSSGVGQLMNCFSTTQEAGGQLKLLNLSSKIQDVLQITRLLALFDYYTEEEQAIQSFE